MSTMPHFDFAVAGMLLQFTYQLLSFFLVPVLLGLSARAVTGIVSAWVVTILWAAAVLKIVLGLPSMFLQPLLRNVTGSHAFGQPFIWLLQATAMANGIVGIAVFVAFLAVCLRLREVQDSRITG